MTIVKLSSYIALAVAAAGALSPDQAMPGATAVDEPRLLLEVNEGGSTLPGDPGAPAYRQGQADIRGGYPSYAPVPYARGRYGRQRNPHRQAPLAQIIDATHIPICATDGGSRLSP
jgi:hypothetical protein